MSGIKVGRRVAVGCGSFRGKRGVIERKRPWPNGFIVRFPDGNWAGFEEHELEPYTVPPEARPLSVGALQHPMRGGR